MKVGGRGREGGRGWRRIRPWKVAGRAESSTREFLMGRLASRESRGTGEQENPREGKGWGGTDCLLIRPDNCRWVRAHLASPCRESPRPHLPSFYLFPFSLPFVRCFALGVPFFSQRLYLSSRSFLLLSVRSSSPLPPRCSDVPPWSLKGISIARTRRRTATEELFCESSPNDSFQTFNEIAPRS